jgi:hypothetical protein
MRFEELAYAGDGLPVTVRFHARLTVVCLPEDERPAWMARLLGVLEGTRAGDGTSVIYVDRRGRRIGLDRDDQGSATLTELATGAEVPYSAGHLSLDGRFDWFAANGLTVRAASDLMVVDSDTFTAHKKYVAGELEAKLQTARTRLARTEKQHQSAMAKMRRHDDLNHRIAELDEQIRQAEAGLARREAEGEAVRAAAEAADDWWRAMGMADDARRAFGARARLDEELLARAMARPKEIPDELEGLANACRAMAERRDDLVDRLDSGAAAEVDETAAEARRELIEDVEPGFVDALAALACTCRPFEVTIDAARIEAAGIGVTGVEALTVDVLSEVADRVAEAVAAGLQRALEDAEAQCRTTRDHLEHHLTGLGFSIDGTDELVAGAESVTARAGETGNPSVDDTRRAIAERARLAQALQRVERNLPDVAPLADKHSALEQDVAALEASLAAGRPLVSVQEAEMMLLRRATEAGRNDRRREPLPLVVKDALVHFGSGDKRRLLDAVAGLADTTQVVYLTDDPDTLAWASAQASAGDVTLWGSADIATVA